MAILRSALDTRSDAYQANARMMQGLVDDLHARRDRVRAGGGERGQRKFRERGKLLPRERVALLVDPETPFLELSMLAAGGMYDDECPGAAEIAGIGVVSGVECLILANDATIKGGASYPMTVRKVLRAQEIAATHRLPCIYLVETAGANLLYQAEFFANIGGRTFANETRMSAAGIPQIALVFGSSTAGGAYVPGLCDYAVLVKGQAKVFLGGPPLVRMATGEISDDETLGGAEMHTAVSGVGDYLAADDADALRIGRQIVADLHWRKPLGGPERAPLPPRYDPEELLGVIPADPKIAFDMREILARVVDDSRLDEFRAHAGTTLVAGHAHLGGYPIGILANNGVLFSDAALKAAHFIQLCDRERTPILYLQNITGFMVGRQAEAKGIIKHGSQMITAVANASVPQYTVIIGGSYGAGNYGMCGRAYDPWLLFAWPNSRVAVMGAEQAAGVLTIIQTDAMRARGLEPDPATLELLRAQVLERFERESSPYYATARLWDDGLLDPRETRQALITGLAAARNRDYMQTAGVRYGIFRL